MVLAVNQCLLNELINEQVILQEWIFFADNDLGLDFKDEHIWSNNAFLPVV